MPPCFPTPAGTRAGLAKAVLASTRASSSHRTPVTSHRDAVWSTALIQSHLHHRMCPSEENPSDIQLAGRNGSNEERAHQLDGVSRRLIAGTRQWGVRGSPDAGTGADRHFRECVPPAPLNYAKGQIPCRFRNMHVIPLVAAADWVFCCGCWAGRGAFFLRSTFALDIRRFGFGLSVGTGVRYVCSAMPEFGRDVAAK